MNFTKDLLALKNGYEQEREKVMSDVKSLKTRADHIVTMLADGSSKSTGFEGALADIKKMMTELHQKELMLTQSIHQAWDTILRISVPEKTESPAKLAPQKESKSQPVEEIALDIFTSHPDPELRMRIHNILAQTMDKDELLKIKNFPLDPSPYGPKAESDLEPINYKSFTASLENSCGCTVDDQNTDTYGHPVIGRNITLLDGSPRTRPFDQVVVQPIPPATEFNDKRGTAKSIIDFYARSKDVEEISIRNEVSQTEEVMHHPV